MQPCRQPRFSGGQLCVPFVLGDTIYHNSLAVESDAAGFRLEGEASISFPNGRLRMENLRDPAEGQRSNFVF